MISVIIPAFNHADYLPRSISSILNQTYQDFEIVVVDDASTDSTREIIKPYPLRYFRHDQNRGPIAAFHTGLLNTKGNYICVLDADDWFPKNSLEIRINILNSSSAQVVHAGLTHISLTGEQTYIPPLPNHLLPDFLAGKHRHFGINNATFLYHRQAFEEIGLRTSNPNIAPHEDYDFALKTLLYCQVQTLDKNTYFYEKHLQSHSAIYGTTTEGQKRLTQLENHYLKLLESPHGRN